MAALCRLLCGCEVRRGRRGRGQELQQPQFGVRGQNGDAFPQRHRRDRCSTRLAIIVCDDDEAVMDVALDGLVLATAWLHTFLSPYTKVEESFNLHAVHDVLMYGVGGANLHKVRLHLL